MADRGPRPAERFKFLQELRKQSKTGMPDATAGLAALGAIGRMLGPVSSAFAGLGGQQFPGRPKDDKTEYLSAQDIPGDPVKGVPNLAEIILALPEKKLPPWFRSFLRAVPEKELDETLRNTWKFLGEGATRKAFQKKGVVGKLHSRPPEDYYRPQYNLEEFLWQVAKKPESKKGADLRYPEALAYATEPGIIFSQYHPLETTVDRSKYNDIINKVKDLNIGDVVTHINPGGRYGTANNWGIMPGKNPRGLIYDTGFHGLPKNIKEKEKLLKLFNINKEDVLAPIFGSGYELSPAAEKLLQILKLSPKTLTSTGY